MSDLAKEKCVACRPDAPPVTESERTQLLAELPDWDLIEEDGIPKLQRAFSFSNFADALAFTVRVAAMAEQEGHHPRLVTEWGRVTVCWWTHKIRNLHRNDFIMAVKTDRCYVPWAQMRT